MMYLSMVFPQLAAYYNIFYASVKYTKAYFVRYILMLSLALMLNSTTLSRNYSEYFQKYPCWWYLWEWRELSRLPSSARTGWVRSMPHFIDETCQSVLPLFIVISKKFIYKESLRTANTTLPSIAKQWFKNRTFFMLGMDNTLKKEEKLGAAIKYKSKSNDATLLISILSYNPIEDLIFEQWYQNGNFSNEILEWNR